MEFSNGTSYQGQWSNHLMHGEGVFRDHLGREWRGEFRNGVFGSRSQVELLNEKVKAARDSAIRS